jgi:hypothetical protein
MTDLFNAEPLSYQRHHTETADTRWLANIQNSVKPIANFHDIA